MVTIILAIAGGGMLECQVLAERAFYEQEGSCPLLTFLLLNRREQPLSILVSHECPDFAGLGRRLFATFDKIARFSPLLGQGHGVITGTPAKPDRCVVRRVFDPGFPGICLYEHHVFNMIGDVEAGLFG